MPRINLLPWREELRKQRSSRNTSVSRSWHLRWLVTRCVIWFGVYIWLLRSELIALAGTSRNDLPAETRSSAPRYKKIKEIKQLEKAEAKTVSSQRMKAPSRRCRRADRSSCTCSTSSCRARCPRDCLPHRSVDRRPERKRHGQGHRAIECARVQLHAERRGIRSGSSGTASLNIIETQDARQQRRIVRVHAAHAATEAETAGR